MKHIWLASTALSAAMAFCGAAGAFAADQAHPQKQLPGAQESHEIKNNSWYVSVPFGTYHLGKREEGDSSRLEFNPGLGVELKRPAFAEAAGWHAHMVYGAGFKHDEEKFSVNADAGSELCHAVLSDFSACAGASIGADTGIGQHMTVTPAAQGFLKLEHEPSGAYTKFGIVTEGLNPTPDAFILQIGMEIS